MFIKQYAESEKVESVYMSKCLACQCKTRRGDPRGLSGITMFTGGDFTRFAYETLLRFGGNVLEGSEENFICIPELAYQGLLNAAIKNK